MSESCAFRPVRFLILHAGLGFGLALVVVAVLFWFNVSNLSTLVATTSQGLLAALVFTILMGQTFAVVQLAFALWLHAEDPRSGGGGGRRDRPRPRHLRVLTVPVTGA
ncbi:hypothetical protein GCM10011505_41460 [Tistrella bauzanensis]|uniref:Uncharacterized protein n=1 Tax=Tistrella bauzanensis TaxID=657419 RepID=A0ABQ1J1B7_9PROT|nr:hypothetical protein [Tistrella bauzanensis]GGB56247.1 hypothetical protein GCM10011505_41460 [Tistrella bauzanensis]